MSSFYVSVYVIQTVRLRDFCPQAPTLKMQNDIHLAPN